MSDREEEKHRRDYDNSEGEGDDVEGEGEEDADSSEEEDDNEEEMQRVSEGFIVDDEEEEEDDAPKKRKKKRRRHQSSQEPETRERNNDQLDEDDLDLLMENAGVSRDDDSRQFKRLKRANEQQSGGLNDFFSDDEEEEGEEQHQPQQPSRAVNEFDDFIEEDEFSDDERRREEERDIRSSQRRMAPMDMGQAAGLDAEKMNDLYEIFGDGEEYDWALDGEDELDNEDQDKQQTELKDVFEPGELKARLLTDEDNKIRVEDVPERYQLLRQACKMDYKLDTEELFDEQTWIREKLQDEHRNQLEARPDLIKPFHNAVRDVVEFIVQEAQEVPFIWHNRRDHLGCMVNDKFEQLLSQNDLWRIVELDIEFHGLLEKKKTTLKIYQDLGLFDAVFDDALQSAKLLVEYQDLMDFVQFRYSAQIKNRRTESNVKRHSRFGRFERIRQSELYQLVKAFGLTAEELAENVETQTRVNFSDDNAQSPLDLAKEFTGAGKDYSQPQQALDEAQQMLAEEIFYNPRLRRVVRKQFFGAAKVDIILTDKGHKKIDPNSPYYEFKYAINRGFEELRLKPELFLKMLQAEIDGLVEVRISYSDYKKTLFEEMLKFFTSDNVSDIATEWNNCRRDIFKAASRKFVPLICRNIKEDLKQDCLRSLYFEVREKFAQKLNQAPYRPPKLAAGETARVFSMSAGNGDFGRDSVLAVMMNEDGQVVRHYKFDDDPREVEFKKRLKETIEDVEPDVICMAGFTVNSSKLYTIVQELISDAQLEASGDSGKPLEVIWAQDEVARLYQNSQRGELEFSEHTALVRYCIALGRYVQSPLLEYAALGAQINAIHIHAHQYLLPAELFQQAIDTVFVDYVNLVGVEINQAVRNNYVANLLPYVSGLGPRKASSILQKLQSLGGLSQRSDLITEQMVPGAIFVNCASFFIISNDKKTARSSETEMLDATRIHPEDYADARTIAKDAFDLDDEDVAQLESRGGIIAHISNNRDAKEKINNLDLAAFAEMMETESNGTKKKLQTLNMIRRELLNPYEELRAPLLRLTDIQVFTMLTGETPDSLAPGAVIPVSVKKATGRFVAVRLGCNIPGNVDDMNMNDSDKPPQMFQFGQTIPAMVRSVNYKEFSADLSTRLSDIERASNEPRLARQDQRKWDFDAEQRDEMRAKAKEAEQNRQRRVIQHPLFKNMNSKQAEEYLAGRADGDVVIRPSSRGIDHIAVTWKVSERMFQHLDVIEMAKPTETTPGRLQVGDVAYSDLDELISEHIGNTLIRVHEITHSQKFNGRKREEIEQMMREFVDSANKSIYIFGHDYKRPGYFVLYYIIDRQSPLQKLSVKAQPNGFSMMSRNYRSYTDLVNAFKQMMARPSAR